MDVAPTGVAVFSCDNGHIVCGHCRQRITKKSCPTCRNRRLFRIRFAERLSRETLDIVGVLYSDYTLTRHSNVELLQIRVKCKFAQNGCVFEMPMATAAVCERHGCAHTCFSFLSYIAFPSYVSYCKLRMLSNTTSFRDIPCVGNFDVLNKCRWSGPEHLLPFHQGESGCFSVRNTQAQSRITFAANRSSFQYAPCEKIAPNTFTCEGTWDDRKPYLLGHVSGHLTRFQIYVERLFWVSVRVRAFCPAAVARGIRVTIVATAADTESMQKCKARKYSYRGGVYFYIIGDGK